MLQTFADGLTSPEIVYFSGPSDFSVGRLGYGRGAGDYRLTARKSAVESLSRIDAGFARGPCPRRAWNDVSWLPASPPAAPR